MIDLAARLVATSHPLTFPEVLELLHAAKYTGPITFHLIHGVPNVVELVAEPVKVHLSRVSPLTPAEDLAHTLR